MTRFFSRRFVKMLRAPALAMLMLAVLVNPVLAAVGDMHESGHGAATTHVQVADDHDHDASAGAQGEEVDLFHAFMHAAHCCGHLTAIFSGPFMPQITTLVDAVPVSEFSAFSARPATDHFRPPIAA